MRVYSFDIRHPNGEIFRIRGAGNSKMKARLHAGERFERIHGVKGYPQPAAKGVFVPESERGPEGL